MFMPQNIVYIPHRDLELMRSDKDSAFLFIEDTISRGTNIGAIIGTLKNAVGIDQRSYQLAYDWKNAATMWDSSKKGQKRAVLALTGSVAAVNISNVALSYTAMQNIPRVGIAASEIAIAISGVAALTTAMCGKFIVPSRYVKEIRTEFTEMRRN